MGAFSTPTATPGTKLASETTGGENSACGWNALGNLTTGRYATAMGTNAGGAETTGGSNSYFGEDVARNGTGNTYLSAFGNNAARNLTGSIGFFLAAVKLAAPRVDTYSDELDYSIGIGYNALNNASGVFNASYLIALGYDVGTNVGTNTRDI